MPVSVLSDLLTVFLSLDLSALQLPLTLLQLSQTRHLLLLLPPTDALQLCHTLL